MKCITESAPKHRRTERMAKLKVPMQSWVYNHDTPAWVCATVNICLTTTSKALHISTCCPRLRMPWRNARRFQQTLAATSTIKKRKKHVIPTLMQRAGVPGMISRKRSWRAKRCRWVRWNSFMNCAVTAVSMWLQGAYNSRSKKKNTALRCWSALVRI